MRLKPVKGDNKPIYFFSWRNYGLIWLCLILALLIIMACDTNYDSKSFPASSTPEVSERVCLSLRVLSRKVSKSIREDTPLPKECRNLAGIGFLEGYIVVNEVGDKDVILVGRISKSRPSLKLDDLIVNMRTISKGKYPYCSLDPYQENIRAFQSLSTKTQDLNSSSKIKTFFQKLKLTIGPQQVVVGGVPRNSRHAHVMIDADYHMKKVSQGHIKLPDVTSYLDRQLNEVKKQILQGSNILPMSVSMARFWFHIGHDSPTFQESEGIVWLDKCSVVVLTEKQMATSTGKLYDVTQDDPQATTFANELSKVFPSVSVPVYADLENLFRLRALLLAMESRGGLAVLGFDFASYIRDFNYYEEMPMEPFLPGLANYREWSHQVQSGNMIHKYYLFPMVCGGVGMDIQVNKDSFRAKDSKRLFSLRTIVLKSRPSKDSLSWVI